MTSVTDQTSSTPTTSSPTLTSQQLTSDSTTSPPPPVSQAAALQSDIQLFESIIREEIDEGDTGNIISNLGNIDIQNFTKIITDKITQYLNVNESHPMIKQNKIFIINSIEELTAENLHLLTKLQIAISCRTMIGIKLNEIDILRDKIMARDSLIKSLIKENSSLQDKISNLHMNIPTPSTDTPNITHDTQSFISSCNNLIKHGNTIDNIKLHTLINNHKKGLQHMTEGLEQMLQLSGGEPTPAANLSHQQVEGNDTGGENL